MDFIIENAKQEDREDIIKVFEQWNMQHIPSVESEELDLSCFFVAKVDENRRCIRLQNLSSWQGENKTVGSLS